MPIASGSAIQMAADEAIRGPRPDHWPVSIQPARDAGLA
jgi:hypothetical protein